MLNFKINGFKKSLKGVLKTTVVYLPHILAIASIPIGVTLMIKGFCDINKVISEYCSTETFVERKNADLENLKYKLDNGEITPQEYSEGIEYFEKSKYVEDLINEDKEENVEFQRNLKKSNIINHSGGIVFAGAATLMMATMIIYKIKYKEIDNILKTAKKDIVDGINLMKAKKQIIDDLNDSSAEQSTVVPNAGNIDNVDQEVLEGIDDYY